MRTRKKVSPIWNSISDDDFRNLILKSQTYSEILRHFGMTHKGGNSKAVKSRIRCLNINDEHIVKGVRSNQGRKFNVTAKPYSEILIENSSYNRCSLKSRLIKDKLILQTCAICNQIPTWMGKFLSLVLDHINGIPNDNRLVNLRLLCPNCNSQTNTFAGKKNKLPYDTLRNKCPNCNHIKLKTSSHCAECSFALRHKIKHPSKEILEQEIKEMTWTALGLKYGVSDNAIKKWAKSYNINFPIRKYNKSTSSIPQPIQLNNQNSSL